MAQMLDIKDTAGILGVTPQSTNRYRRKVEEAIREETGNPSFSLGEPDPNDRRRTLFSEQELEQIRSVVPNSVLNNGSVDAELIEEEEDLFSIASEKSYTGSIIPVSFHQINIRVTASDTSELDTETQNIAAIGQHAAKVLYSSVVDGFTGRIAGVKSRLDNLATAIETAAVTSAAQAAGNDATKSNRRTRGR